MDRRRKPTVYLGGPIDYAGGIDHEEGWQHQAMDNLPIDAYCPSCRYVPGEPIEDTMARNVDALLESDLAVFMLDGTFTVGTPIEIAGRLMEHPAGTVVVHPGEPGLYVRQFEARGALLLRGVDELWVWFEWASR